MAKTDQQIVAEITSYVDDEKYSNWYSGIATKPRARLFGTITSMNMLTMAAGSSVRQFQLNTREALKQFF